MARKTKEENVIEHGEYMLKELHRVYQEGIGIDEYSKLLKEYKRLHRRQEKMIKLADSMGYEIMEQNESLNKNLQYTIQTARSKLLENVTQHRKTKDAYVNFKEKIEMYSKALEESYEENNKMHKKLKYYIKNFGEINHQFSDGGVQPQAISINPKEYQNMDIGRLLSFELINSKGTIVLCKVALSNFDKMITQIEETSSINNFLLGTYKYLKNCFAKEDIVFHHEMEVFYILCFDKELGEVKSSFNLLNKKRRVFDFEIKFISGLTKYNLNKDTKDILLKRCDSAFEEAKQDESLYVVK